MYLCTIMNNTRFATLIHILTLLSRYKGQWVNSDWMASSIHIHPVIVRKELSVLQEKGWVVTKKGKEGGAALNVSEEQISLADIYRAVKNSNVLGRKNNCTAVRCPVGKSINTQLDDLFAETDEAVYAALENRTLRSFAEQFD